MWDGEKERERHKNNSIIEDDFFSNDNERRLAMLVKQSSLTQAAPKKY